MKSGFEPTLVDDEDLRDAITTLNHLVQRRIGIYEQRSGNRLPRDQWTVTVKANGLKDGHPSVLVRVQIEPGAAEFDL